MKMLLFKPELGTLKIINYPEDGRIHTLVDPIFNTHKIVIDDVEYKFFTSTSFKEVADKYRWSFYKRSNEQKFYGNIVIQALHIRDINAEDILRIKSHIVVNPKGYMIYID